MLSSSVRQTKLNKTDMVLEQEDWNKLLTLSAYHQVIPLIFEAAHQLDEFRLHPPAVAYTNCNGTMWASSPTNENGEVEFLAIWF